MMRHTWLYLTNLLLLGLALGLPREALCQGCDQTYTATSHWSCDNGLTICQSTGCTPIGDPHEFCSIGYGLCCGRQTLSANTINDPWDCCQPPSDGCPDGEIFSNCECQAKGGSPIIVDTTGRGFYLTSADSGVVFDIAGDGHPHQMGWTTATSGNAFLALDRNHNGYIENGTELFGDFTQQPKSDRPNGFLALAEFDKPENGGNGDGVIDNRDAVFSRLLLWIDENHDGISQRSELYTLPQLGVFSLALRFKESRRTDGFGNQFRYKAAVNPDPSDGESKDGRWAYDVFFVIANKAGATRGNCGRTPQRAGGHSVGPLLPDRIDITPGHSGGASAVPADNTMNSGGGQ